MYADPALIRDHVVKLRLNDNEADLIGGAAEKRGLTVAEYCREVGLMLVRRELTALGMKAD